MKHLSITNKVRLLFSSVFIFFCYAYSYKEEIVCVSQLQIKVYYNIEVISRSR